MAALPAVAVAHNAAGSVAVLYDTADALDEHDKPYFSVHLAMSQDHGTTFQTVLLQTSCSLITLLPAALALVPWAITSN